MGRTRRPRHSVFRTIIEQQYDESARYRLIKSVKGSTDWVQRLGPLSTLPIHSGCVNCICWNNVGDKLLSGSDDQHLIITHPHTGRILSNYKSNHRANIFSAKFLPYSGDTGIVSCSGDGMILHTDILRTEETHNNIFTCHIGTTYEISTIPDDPNCFLSCGEDCTVRCFDLRTKQKCNKIRCNEDVMIMSQRPVTALCINLMRPNQLAIGCSDSTVRIYDRRMLTIGCSDASKLPYDCYKAPNMDGKFYRITSLSYSPCGEDILVSYSSEHLYLFGIKNRETTVLSPDDSSVDEEQEASVTESGGSRVSIPVAPVRRLRLRGDWSDTGPDARPQNDSASGGASQARPTLHGTLMQRMTDVLSRMLNDPATRAALSQGGEDIYPEPDENPSSQNDNSAQDDSGGALGNQEDEGSTSATVGSADNGGAGGSEPEEHADASPSSSRENNEPLDLPLPSFSSTYSSFVKPPGEETPMETSSVDDGGEDLGIGATEVVESTPSTSSQQAPDHKNPSQLSELSHMYQGFVQRNGVEPMVNLTYSDVGSTASSISVFVGEDASRTSELPESSSQMSQNSQSSQLPSQSPPSANVSLVQELVSSPEPPGSHMSDDDMNEEEYGFSEDDDLNSSFTVGGSSGPRAQSPDKPRQGSPRRKRHDSDDDDDDDTPHTRKLCVNYKQKFTGHRNSRTMIKEATFWGNDYVISGSDCGHIFMWEKETAKLKMLLQADHHVVNCVQPHPYLPILASSGIDYDVKLWAPVHEDSHFEPEMAEELEKRNAIMLEETRDTITVPASFMIRMLACLNQIRRGGRRHTMRRESNANSD
uniref:DDB1-and CUL4-associated factor 6 n=2 Tax=Lygus hesperus TaxID=30085 RepID=A0A0A9YTF5_LYGHE